MVVCRAKDNQKIQKKLLQSSLSLQDYRSGPRKRSISWNPFSPCAKGAIATAETLFFAPADAVSDPKKVRILGNPTRFFLFFLTPQMQSLTLKRYVFWEIQLAFPCFLSEKRAKENSLFVNKSKYTCNQETTLGLTAGNFAITIHWIVAGCTSTKDC